MRIIMKKKYYISVLFLLSITLQAEPSVYGNSKGFVSPQKVMSENKKHIARLRQEISEQKEQIEGLKSIVEGLSATIHTLSQKTHSASTAVDSNQSMNLLHELGSMIDKINADYVTKEELNRAISGKHTILNVDKDDAPEITKVKTPAQMYSEGVRLFAKHRYNEANSRFTLTDKQAYKGAASNYYLGEIAYYTKKYEDAIRFYKKSAGLNDKASYIDTLLLHTAIALESTGEKAQAKVFYENIVANYPEKRTASIASEKLKKL